MKRLLLFTEAMLAVLTVSCGGSGNSFPPPPPVTGNFTNANLQGSYAFSMSGTDASANPGAFLARVGSFTADGKGGITAALEDVIDGNTVAAGTLTGTGSYAIQANGKGAISLNALSGSLQFTVVLNSPASGATVSSKGMLIQTDLNATSSGNLILQPSLNTVSQATINGSYAFDIAGIDNVGAPLSIVGQMVTNGGGTITGGIYDSDDAGTLITAQTFGSGGTYSAPDTTFGHGTMTFNNRTFDYFLVDATRIRLIETDNALFTFGDAVLQTGVPTQTAAGSFAFLVGGSSVLGSRGAIVRGARFTTDAAGAVSAIQFDDNNNGAITSPASFTNAKYAVDTVNNGTGRATLTFLGSGQANPYTFVLYFSSASDAVFQDTTMGVVADGSMSAQAASFSSSTLAANYVFNWSGVNLSQTNGFEEDFAGQYALSGSGSINGEVDFVELGSSSSRIPAFLNIPVTGTFSLNGDGTGANGYTITTGNSPSTTFKYHAYLTSSNTMLLVGIDTNRVIAGNATPQP